VIKAALADGGVEYGDVEQAVAGYVFGDSTCGQRAVYDVGLTGIPVYNVNNNCSTGSSALMLAKQMVEGGIVECALAVGFEQMKKGALGSAWNDRPNPLGLHVNVMNDTQGFTSAPPAAQMFGGAGREYRWKYGAKRETFAKVNAKARQHAAKNPYALFRDLLSVEEILASPEVFDPLTRYQCCPPTCGAAAAIVCSDDFAKKKGISNPVYIAAQTMRTDYGTSFSDSMRQRTQRRRCTKSPASDLKTSMSSSFTTASPPTKCSPTKHLAFAPKARPRSSSRTATTLTAASSSPTRVVVSFPRGIR